MYCTHCGAVLSEAARFCSACGAPAGTHTAPASGAPAQPAAAAPAPQPGVQPGGWQPPAPPPVWSYPVYVMAPPPAAAPGASAPTGTVPAGGVRTVVTAPIQSSPVTAASGTPAYQTGGVQNADLLDAVEDEEDLQDEASPTPAPLGAWPTFWCLLALFCLPLGNIIFACVWAFGQNTHPSRRALARAALPLIAIGLVALFCALLWATTHLSNVTISLR